jgi:hypothetical protein
MPAADSGSDLANDLVDPSLNRLLAYVERQEFL